MYLPTDVREALRFGAGTFTAESLGQLTLVDAEAAAAGVRVPTPNFQPARRVPRV